MHYGFVLPNGDARRAADWAAQAEAAGWDGFFVWEPVWGFDAWVSLTAAAMTTQRLRLGTLLTPLSRRRPWKLASETVNLDYLSGGRLILSVGLGALDTGFAAFGEVTDRRTRAELLDEGLEVLAQLWRGAPGFQGQHYQVTAMDFPAPPPSLQQPRIPVWVVGAWPSRKSLRRVARWDGLIPSTLSAEGPRQSTPEELRDILAALAEMRPAEAAPLEVIVEGESQPGEENPALEAYRQAGATWWMEAHWSEQDPQRVLERLQAGPPRRP